MKPQFIISKSITFEKLNFLKSIFDEVSYSWKTNPTVGSILNENESCYMSVHSIPELEQVKNKNKVWFFLFAINEEILDELFNKYNLKNFVVDNPNDLDFLINYIEKNNLKINLLLRMKLRENTIFTGKHYVFGMRVKTIQEYILKLNEDKNIEKIGVHFHRKTQNVSEWSLKEEVAQSLGEEYLEKIDIMNLGGGLPGKYENSHDREMQSIVMKINELKDYLKKFNVQLIIEPGRFIASPSVKLKCQIIAIYDDTCFVNVSIFNGALDTVIANVKLIVSEECDKYEGKSYTIKGCTPDSTDILRYRVYLKDPKVGDTITFENCGAYTYTTNFCALPKIDEIIVD